jgi:lipid-A-disaccharide synthase
MSCLDSKTQLLGIFDEAHGTPLYRPQEFAVMGFVDVLKRIRFFKHAHTAMIALAQEADQVLLMDSSSFNIPLAKALKRTFPHKKITYYILPQVWAWKSWRAKALDSYCDDLCGILPFEIPYYANAVFVGHPLLDVISKVKEQPKGDGSIVYMPGSRRREIRMLMPVFRELRKKINKQSILVVPPFISDHHLEDVYGDIRGFHISKNAHEALYCADYAFICSGTATLEAAMIGTPFALAYKATWLDYWIVRSFVRLKYVGLANILFQAQGKHPIHAEFLQKNVTVSNLLCAYENRDPEASLDASACLRKYLKHGSAKRVASLIYS